MPTPEIEKNSDLVADQEGKEAEKSKNSGGNSSPV